MGQKHVDAANRRWSGSTPDQRKANTAAAKAASAHRNRAAHQILRSAEDAITAAGGRVEWPR